MLPLSSDINVRTQNYTFSHCTGLLFGVQFARHGRHTSALVDVVSYHGIPMLHAAECDSVNGSRYITPIQSTWGGWGGVNAECHC
jgi:hypothetical protein